MTTPVNSSRLSMVRNVAIGVTLIGGAMAAISFIAAMHGGNPTISSITSYSGVGLASAGVLAFLVAQALLYFQKPEKEKESEEQYQYLTQEESVSEVAPPPPSSELNKDELLKAVVALQEGATFPKSEIYLWKLITDGQITSVNRIPHLDGKPYLVMKPGDFDIGQLRRKGRRAQE